MNKIEIKPIEINLNHFSKTSGTKIESRYVKPAYHKPIKERYLKYKNAEKLAKDISIDKNCRYFIILDGTFIAGDLIEAIAVNNNYHIKSMTVSTLSMSNNNIDSFANLLNGDYVDELNIIVSDYFFSHERNTLITYMYEELDKNDKFQLAVASTHTKICIFETHCGLKIVIHGSANLRSSSNIEQIMIEENEDLYNFNKEFHDNIINKFKTINKSLRRKTLWQAVVQEKEKLVD
jgi:hypothetical protein